MAEQDASFQDPKIVLTINIIHEMQEVSDLLNAGYIASAAKKLLLLMFRLEVPKEGEQLKKIMDVFTIKNYSNFTSDQIIEFYQKTNDYLNRTYYADSRRARPKIKSSNVRLGAENQT